MKKIIVVGTAERGDPLLNFSHNMEPGEALDLIAAALPPAVTASAAENAARNRLRRLALVERVNAVTNRQRKFELAERVRNLLGE